MTTVPESAHLTTTEVARFFGIHHKTVLRRAKSGRLRCARTLGGHRRFDRAELLALLEPGEVRVIAAFDKA